MNSEDKRFLITIGIIGIILIGGYAGLVIHSGFGTPFSVVMSESMQHDDTRSQIGCIDTGDVVIVQSPEKADIVSYVEGTITGYSTFGDYGSVIIYERGNGHNPVIHRAIIWLDYNASTNSWSAPSLKDYKGEWSCETKDYNNLQGTLTFYNLTQSGKTIEIRLDSLGKNSGFLTLGDNPVTNTSFDQPGTINHPVTLEEIKSVPIAEIPWIGVMKILIKKGGENLEKVPNSLPSLFMSFLLIISLLLLIDMIAVRKNSRDIERELKMVRKK